MQNGASSRITARKTTILLLLAAKNRHEQLIGPIDGTTRLQKLVFLVKEKIENDLKNNAYLNFDFNYIPEKYGPADLDLYQDIDFLRAMKFIIWDDSELVEPSEEPVLDQVMDLSAPEMRDLLLEEREETKLSFEYLIGVDPSELLAAETETESERRYAITTQGIDVLAKLHEQSQGEQKNLFEQLMKACIEIRQQFDGWALHRLLKYVYERYESMTTKSLILDQFKGH